METLLRRHHRSLSKRATSASGAIEACTILQANRIITRNSSMSHEIQIPLSDANLEPDYSGLSLSGKSMDEVEDLCPP